MALDADTQITWYGHSCFELVTPGGLTLLFDPWFANPRSPRAAATVDRCDVMLVTHAHDDHFGDALALASRFRPFWPCIHELSLWLGRRLSGGMDAALGMNKGGTVHHRGISISMVRADHSAGDWSVELGAPAYFGEPVGFVVTMENGFRIYFAGDTDVFSDMRLIADLYQPHLAFLPIGGHFTMDPRTAALAVELLGVADVIPMHFGTFPILAGTPAALREQLAFRGVTATVHDLEPGVPLR